MWLLQAIQQALDLFNSLFNRPLISTSTILHEFAQPTLWGWLSFEMWETGSNVATLATLLESSSVNINSGEYLRMLSGRIYEHFSR